MSSYTTRLTPATAELDLEFAAGEDMDIELQVVDADCQPVPLSAAVGTVALRGCDPDHVWSVEAGNLTLGQEVGVIYLHSTAEQTTGWARDWGDSEWQLDVVDIFGRRRRACEGDVTVFPTRVGGTCDDDPGC